MNIIDPGEMIMSKKGRRITNNRTRNIKEATQITNTTTIIIKIILKMKVNSLVNHNRYKIVIKRKRLGNVCEPDRPLNNYRPPPRGMPPPPPM